MLHSKRHRSRLTPLVCLAFLLARVAFAAPVSEPELKLALTYKIAKFVTWPVERDNSGQFSLCLLGEHPFESALENVGKLKIRERGIVVVHVTSIRERAAACDLVFISRSESDRLKEILAELDGKPVLTISDISRFAARGGIVELQTIGNHIGFEINVAAYRRAGLVISSQLLQLATRVGDAQAASQ